MKYEAMDDDDTQPLGTMIQIAIAVLAILLGGAGLYFGFSANKRLNSMDTSIQESTTSAAEMEKAVAFFDSRIASLETKISDQARIINRLKVYNSQSEQALKQLSGELSKNREQIVKTTNELNQIKSGQARVGSVASGVNQQSADEALTTVNGTSKKFGSERIYTIVSGDNFSKIAAQFGVSVQAIEAANPGVNSRRLRIGQQITIPVE